MKYPLFIFIFFLSGCIFDQNKPDSTSVQLTNFRSATELSYKTTNSDWIKIEDDPDDILIFEAEDDKKYQVSIDCPFNEYNKKRLYLLDSKNFPQLDLSCDAMLDSRITIDEVPDNVISYELYTPYSLDTFIFFPCIACFILGDSEVVSTMRRIDKDKEIEVMGEVCFDTDTCQMFYRKELSNYIFDTNFIDLNDKNFLYDFPAIEDNEYKSSDDYLYSGNYFSNYLSSNKKLFPLTNNGKNFGVPIEIRSKNDGYLHSLLSSNNPFTLFSSSYLIFYASAYSNYSGIRVQGEETVEIPEVQLNPTFIRSDSEDEKDSISFNEFIGTEFKTNYYSLVIKNYQLFIANSYAENNHFTIELPEKITHDESEDSTFFSIFYQLHVNGIVTKNVDGSHIMKPVLSIQDSSYHDIFNTPQNENE
jgi:hypothetical protein